MSETATTEKLVLREDADGICTLTLNRPEKRNAVNPELFTELRRHVRDLEQQSDTIGCIILRGAGASFCAGHDLGASPKTNALGWLRMELMTLEKLTKLRQPVIAAVHGHCFTGGLEMALSADFIIAGESAVFADTHGKWGLVPGWGLSQRLPRRVGQAKALEMMLTCGRYTGRQAEVMGLANTCVPDEQLMSTATELCKTIMSNSWHSNAANKKLIYETDGQTLTNGIAHEIFRNEGFAADKKDRVGKFG